MELTTDVLLRGTAWNRAIDALSPIFRARPHYMLYMLSMSIGIMYDQRIQKPEENGEDVRSIPRNVFHNNDNGKPVSYTHLQGEWSEENLKYVELLKAAFSVLGEEMVFDCIMAPEMVTPVIQMLDNFQDEMKPYIEMCIRDRG